MASMYYTSGSVRVLELSMDNSGSLLFHHTLDFNGVLHAIACRVPCRICALNRMRVVMSLTRVHMVYDFADLCRLISIPVAAVIAIAVVAVIVRVMSVMMLLMRMSVINVCGLR